MRNGNILGICIYLTFIFCSYSYWNNHSTRSAGNDITVEGETALSVIPIFFEAIFHSVNETINKHSSWSNPEYNCKESIVLDCNNDNNQELLNTWIDSLNFHIEDPNNRIDARQFNISSLFSFCDSQIAFEIEFSSQRICEGIIRLEDNFGPEIECDSILTLHTHDESSRDKYSNYLNELPISDCTTFSSTSSIDPNTLDIDCMPDTLLELVIFAIDKCGNRSQCQTHLSIMDTTDIKLVCPENIIIDCDSPDMDNILTSWLSDVSFLPSASGNRNDISHTAVQLDFYNNCLFEQIITWNGVDMCSRPTSCNSTVRIIDNTGPILECSDTVRIAQTSLNNLESELLNIIDPIVTDECSSYALNTYFILPLDASTCDSVISREVKIEASDTCSNSSECNSILIIEREMQPTITCPPSITVQCQDDNMNTLITNWINQSTAIDFEQNKIDVITKPALSEINQKVCNAVEPFAFYAIDKCSRTVECSSSIYIMDTIPPDIKCPIPITIDLSSKTFETKIKEWEESLIVLRECNDYAITNNLPSLQDLSLCTDEIEVRFSAKDACDNINRCVSNVEIKRDYKLDIKCPENWTLRCLDINDPEVYDELFEFIQVDATLNYELYWESEGIPMHLNCAEDYHETIHFEAVDQCDNKVDCSTIIEWQAKLNVYIPNTISSNATPPNNGLVIYSNQENVVVRDLFIYDKWGNLIFEMHDFPANDSSYKWDGNQREKSNTTTVFTYLVNIEDSYGEKNEYIGTISMIN